MNFLDSIFIFDLFYCMLKYEYNLYNYIKRILFSRLDSTETRTK
jgi:hypothetical protein